MSSLLSRAAKFSAPAIYRNLRAQRYTYTGVFNNGYFLPTVRKCSYMMDVHPAQPEVTNHQKNCRLSPVEEEHIRFIKKLSTGNGGPKSLEIINFTKLLLLLEKRNNYLRGEFINLWNSIDNLKWEDTEENRKRFIKKLGLHFNNFDYYEQTVISSRNINTWYSTILVESMRILDAPIPFDILDELELIQSNMCGITDDKYHELWRNISILLLELNVPIAEIDELKPSIISQPTQQLSPEIDLQVRVLKDWGERALKEGLMKESIKLYTKAIHTPGISYDELCKLYYIRSAVYRQCNENSAAERDASCALYFNGLVQKVNN